MWEKLNKDMASAMKGRNKERLETLRMLKAKVLHVNARGDLDEKEIIKLFQNYQKSLKETLDILKANGKPDEAKKIEGEMAIVSEYLPKMMSEDETRTLVKETVARLGLTSKKEMGRLMKEILTGRSDINGSLVNKIASEFLQ